ncbi:hypothetical protein ACVWY0_002726 [Arthrobacter sp. UYNi723]
MSRGGAAPLCARGHTRYLCNRASAVGSTLTLTASAAGLKRVWTSPGFVGRFSLPLPERDTGYGHSRAKVDSVKAPSALLLEYYDAVHRQTVDFLQTLGDEDFDRIVDTRWDPPVTLGVRLVSTIADCLQHVGQAAYAKGLNP